jgi:hypothetical protein
LNFQKQVTFPEGLVDENIVDAHHASRDANYQVFSPLCANRFLVGAHLGIGIMLMCQGKDWHERTPMIVVVQIAVGRSE